MADVVIGVDVGSRSVRAGIFYLNGALLATENAPIPIDAPREGYAQQRSADIWSAVARSVSGALRAAGEVTPRGIGFDATCSLVISDAEAMPLSVDQGGRKGWDVLMWMDHRAWAEAEDINATAHPVLNRVGGRISLEMEIPKMLWLKRNLPDIFARIASAWDLPDWLTWRATGDATRSTCSLGCKWSYQVDRGLSGEGWDSEFLDRIGLPELADGRIAGDRLDYPGAAVGRGLSEQAAAELGLPPGLPVAISAIDAYAGAIGTLGAGAGADGPRMAMICGTSTCHVIETRDPMPVPGVWGPYPGAMREGRHALEAGQSAAGALLDRVIAAFPSGLGHAEIAEVVRSLGAEEDSHRLTAHVHVQPDFHGNRSPLADPTRTGAIAGLTMAQLDETLARRWLATIQALAYGTRAIVEAMKDEGVEIGALVASGGLARNPFYLREHADATGLAVIVPEQSEPVLLGSAILGAVASGVVPDLAAGMSRMNGPAHVIAPRGGAIADYHDRKYRVYRRMTDDVAAYRNIMEE